VRGPQNQSLKKNIPEGKQEKETGSQTMGGRTLLGKHMIEPLPDAHQKSTRKTHLKE